MSRPKPIILGTRGSVLALRQTESILYRLRQLYPQRDFAVKKITTTGDRARDVPLERLGGEGVFTKELEAALISGEIDLAVHSLKDVPTALAQGLILAAVSEREDARDVLVSRWNLPLAQLPQGASLGTGSIRRAAQLKAFRPDFEIRPLRGNIDTRLRKALGGDFDGIVMAAAGLLRLGWQDRITEYLSPQVCLPAVGQGALVVEVRDGGAKELASALNHLPTWQAVSAERAFLETLGGGCRVPIAALGRVLDGDLELEGMVASVDGGRLLRAKAKGSSQAPADVGQRLAQDLLEKGAGDILRGVEG